MEGGSVVRNVSPDRQRLDFGRLYCCGELAKGAGHSWSLLPVDWFEKWCKYTGYDRFKDQGAWSSYFRKYKSFDVFDSNRMIEAREHFSKADYGIDLLANSANVNGIVSPPGPIDLRALLVLSTDGNSSNNDNNNSADSSGNSSDSQVIVDSDNLIGPRIKVGLREEVDYVLVPEEAQKALIAWYGIVGPKVSRSLVSSSNRLIVDIYPELRRYEEGSLVGLDPLELSTAEEPDNSGITDEVEVGVGGGGGGLSTPTSPSRLPLPCANSNCQNKSSEKGQCSRCKSTRYCSEECQRVHWPIHKVTCKTVPVVPVYAIVDPKKVNGKVGLNNIGNTCFMNSSLQALSAVWPLTEYFLSERYKGEINEKNPLGTKGKLVRAYGALLEELWKGSRTSVTPSEVRRNVSSFTSNDMFRSYEQQDAQELLNFLIDGLHEDLNLVLQKPAVVDEESDGSRPDELVSRLSLEKYHLRNKSRIVDLMAGLFKNTVECHTCNKKSIKFDPFQIVTVPIPTNRTGSKRYCFVYLHRMYYDPQDPRTWNLLPVGSNSESADSFWAAPRSVQADYRGKAGGALNKRFVRYLVGADRSNFTLKSIRKELSALSGVDPECLVFEAVKALEFADVFVDSSDLSESIPDIFGENRSGNLLMAFETASPRWHQPRLNDVTAFMDPTDAPPIIDVNQRQSSARVLMLAEVKFKEFANDNNDIERIKSRPLNDTLYGSTSLGPQVFSVSKDTTIAQLRFIAARQLYPVVGNKLRAHLITTAGRSVTEVETVRILASMLMLHTHRSCCSDEKARWLPEILPNGLDADGKDSASAQTIGDIGGGNCFKTAILEMGRTKHPYFVWTKVIIYLRSDLIPFIDVTASEEFEDDPRSKEIIDSLSAKLKEPIKLEDCIRTFSEPELLDEQNLYYCGGCKQHSKKASKELAIWSLPDVVFIHLSRFKKRKSSYGYGMGAHKIEDLVQFPLVGLDLSEFELKSRNRASSGGAESSSTPKTPNLYDCIAVVNHMGSMAGGHYTAYANHEISQYGGYGAKELQGTGGKWFLFDDSHCGEVENEARVVSKSAYVLVFQKRRV